MQKLNFRAKVRKKSEKNGRGACFFWGLVRFLKFLSLILGLLPLFLLFKSLFLGLFLPFLIFLGNLVFLENFVNF